MMPVPVVAVVVERDAVEFLERICQLAAWRGEPAVEWHTLHATRRHGETLVRRGFECRSNAHCVVRKKGCDLTSDAPARDPSRRSSSLIRSFRMRDLQRLRCG